MGTALTLVALAWLGLSIWFVVISVRFLRSGRKAFDRYVALTTAAVPAPSSARHAPPAADPAIIHHGR